MMIPENELLEEENNGSGNFEYVTDDVPAFLCTVNNHTEADMVEALLKSSNIPVMRKWRTGGDIAMVYMAVNFSGADIYVPSKLLERAKMLLPDDCAEYEPDDYDKEEDLEASYEFSELAAQAAKARRTRVWWILGLIWGIPLAVILVGFLVGRIFGG